MVNKLKRVLQVSLDWKIKQLIEAEQEKKNGNDNERPQNTY